MKQILSAVLFISIIFFSCKKESSPNGNRPPEEVAGARSQGKGNRGFDSSAKRFNKWFFYFIR